LKKLPDFKFSQRFFTIHEIHFLDRHVMVKPELRRLDMRPFFYLLLALSLLPLMVVSTPTQASRITDEITGDWFPPDGAALLRIERQQDAYSVYILRQSSDAVLHPQIKDVRNPDTKLRERCLQGLRIGKGFQFDDDKWKHGSLYDPASGRQYRASIEIIDEHHLKVRGYVGFELFGRSQIWTSKSFFTRTMSQLIAGNDAEESGNE
jgi:uncharacterized protein (DUF2147 family)